MEFSEPCMQTRIIMILERNHEMFALKSFKLSHCTNPSPFFNLSGHTRVSQLISTRRNIGVIG